MPLYWCESWQKNTLKCKFWFVKLLTESNFTEMTTQHNDPFFSLSHFVPDPQLCFSLSIPQIINCITATMDKTHPREKNEDLRIETVKPCLLVTGCSMQFYKWVPKDSFSHILDSICLEEQRLYVQTNPPNGKICQCREWGSLVA